MSSRTLSGLTSLKGGGRVKGLMCVCSDTCLGARSHMVLCVCACSRMVLRVYVWKLVKASVKEEMGSQLGGEGS